MRFTVTIEAPEGASALQGLANLPEGWRVVEYREVEKKEPTTPSIAELLRRQVVDPFSMVSIPKSKGGLWDMSLKTTLGATVPTPPKDPEPANDIVSYLNPNTAILKDGTLRDVVESTAVQPESNLTIPATAGDPLLFMHGPSWRFVQSDTTPAGAKARKELLSELGGLIGTSPAVPPDTIVALNPDGTIAAAEKVDA